MAFKSRHLLATVAVVGLAAGIAAPARADLIVARTATSQNADGSYTYTYGVTLTSGSELVGTQTYAGGDPNNTPAPQFATVYDFGPITNNASGNATAINSSNPGYLDAFTFSTALTNQPAQLTTPVDNPNLTNIRLTYDNPYTLFYVAGDTPTPLAGTANAIQLAATSYNLGSFDVISQYAPDPNSDVNYDANTYKNTNATLQGNVGFLAGPQIPTAVPEPASLAMLGAGLVGLGFIRRRKSV